MCPQAFVSASVGTLAHKGTSVEVEFNGPGWGNATMSSLKLLEVYGNGRMSSCVKRERFPFRRNPVAEKIAMVGF